MLCYIVTSIYLLKNALMRKSFLNFAIIALLILGQCLTIAHAAEFGTGTHEHGGVECFIALPKDNYDTPLLSFSECFQVIIGSQVSSTPVPSTVIISLFYIYPPSTGPPSTL